MKKVLILIMSLFLLTSCFNQDDQQKQLYYKYLDRLVETTIFNNKALPANIEVFKNEGTTKKFHYEIIISEPKIVMEDLQIMAKPVGYDFDELLPNFNVIEKVDVTSFNEKQTAIKLNFFSVNDYKEFKVLLAYKEDGVVKEVINLFPVQNKISE